ncbi:hypothetical protein, partial [Nocardia cyriacigeorgica]|uniref:hypothetical protein n=1 Tax=Nocardia cyriacigeorgica TaxID=135487 RepID=UPI0024587BFD
PWLSEHDLSHLDAFHAAARLLVDGRNARPFTLTTRPLDPPIPGPGEWGASAAVPSRTASTANAAFAPLVETAGTAADFQRTRQACQYSRTRSMTNTAKMTQHIAPSRTANSASGPGRDSETPTGIAGVPSANPASRVQANRPTRIPFCRIVRAVEQRPRPI